MVGNSGRGLDRMQSMPDQVLNVGDPAPELQLNTREGGQVSLSEFLGKPVLVTFLSHAA